MATCSRRVVDHHVGGEAIVKILHPPLAFIGLDQVEYALVLALISVVTNSSLRIRQRCGN